MTNLKRKKTAIEKIEHVLTLSGCDIWRDWYYVCTTGVLGKELSVDRHHGKWNSAYRCMTGKSTLSIVHVSMEIKIHVLVYREIKENVCPCLECSLCTIFKTNKE